MNAPYLEQITDGPMPAPAPVELFKDVWGLAPDASSPVPEFNPLAGTGPDLEL